MTQLRIRRKPGVDARSPLTLMPVAAGMALILAAGIGSTLFLDSGKLAPGEAVGVAEDRADAAFSTVLKAYLKTQTFALGGREWVLAPHDIVDRFAPEEMVTVGHSGGWGLAANQARGLAGLSEHPTAYDRLYLDLGGHRYAPLRWRRTQ